MRNDPDTMAPAGARRSGGRLLVRTPATAVVLTDAASRAALALLRRGGWRTRLVDAALALRRLVRRQPAVPLVCLAVTPLLQPER